MVMNKGHEVHDQAQRVPVLRCVLYALLFLRRNIVYVYTLGVFYIGLQLFSVLTISLPGFGPSLSFMASLAAMGLGVMIMAAFLRRALNRPKAGPLGLQFGGDEGRLFIVMVAVNLIIGFIVFLGAMAALFAVSAVVSASVDPAILETEPAAAFSQGGPAVTIAFIAAGIGLFLLWLYAIARFALAYVATIARQRVMIFEAAVLTKGEGWRIAAAFLLLGLPFLLLVLPAAYFEFQHIMALGAFDKGADPLALIGQLNPFSAYFLMRVALWPAFSAAFAGMYAVLYQGLSPTQDKEKGMGDA